MFEIVGASLFSHVQALVKTAMESSEDPGSALVLLGMAERMVYELSDLGEDDLEAVDSVIAMFYPMVRVALQKIDEEEGMSLHVINRR